MPGAPREEVDMSLSLYEAALREPATSLLVRFCDGTEEQLALDRWRGPLDAADEELLSRVATSALDVGCGPGRLSAALAARGVPALGLDIVPAAVLLARSRGARAVEGSVFGPVPGAGHWGHALLADGNIGIGGDPARLLRRLRALVAPGGVVATEVLPAGAGSGPVCARLEEPGGRVGSWFPWARVDADAVAPLAQAAGLCPRGTWTREGRVFAELERV